MPDTHLAYAGEEVVKKYKSSILKKIKETTGKKRLRLECGVNFPGDEKMWVAISEIDGRKNIIAIFRLRELPGCCAFLVSTGTWIMEKHRSKGLGTYLLKVKEAIARDLGYSFLFCTTIQANEAQNHLLRKNGWSCNEVGVNKRTGNTVYTWIKTL